jgi:hypothetical protein
MGDTSFLLRIYFELHGIAFLLVFAKKTVFDVGSRLGRRKRRATEPFP